MSEDHIWLDEIERELGFSPYRASPEELAIALFKVLIRLKKVEAKVDMLARSQSVVVG